MTWKEGVVMTWGGLRGAVSLALALQVAHHNGIDQKSVGIRVLVHVSGIVFLTLLINSTTVVGLLKILGMGDTSPIKRMAMANSLRFLLDVRDKTLNMLKTDRFLADADWDTVEKSCDIDNPYKTDEKEALTDDCLEIRPTTICPDCDAKLPRMYTAKELREITSEAIHRMLKAERLSYWRQFEQGMISREGVRKLQECTDIADDKKGKFIDVEDVKISWEIPRIYIKLKRLIKRFMVDFTPEHSQSFFVDGLYYVMKHQAFSIIVYCIIALDMANVTLSVVSEYLHVMNDRRNVFRALNAVFVSFYILEGLVKIIFMKKSYVPVCWKYLSLAIILVGTVDVILSFTLPAIYGDEMHAIIVVFILMRLVRLFRLLEATMPLLLNLVKLLISQKLSYGYDVGRGYVAGEEEVRKLIDHMVDHKDIANTLKQTSDNGRLDVIRCLGMLQKQHPDIALSIKTRQAIRSVLNSLRDGIHELLADGILEEADGHKLEKMVEEMMKRLLNSPPSLRVPPPDKMLNNVVWLKNDANLIAYIKEKAKLISHNYEDVIMHEGDLTDGIYIIVSGLVRLESTGQHGRPAIVINKQSSSQLKIKATVIDFLTSGNIIGEMGLLTKKPRTITVKCETAVQLLFISIEDMEHAFNHFPDIEPPLEYRLWHVCANRIATNVLMKQQSYQGWTKEKIKIRLENSYLLSAVEDNIFTVDSSMSDVVLINGFAQNAFTREQYVGPCYIPWTVLKLQLLPEKGPKPVLLIIPSEAGQAAHPSQHSSHKIRHSHGAFSQSISQLCLPHIAKQQVMDRKLKKIQAAKSLGILPKGRVETHTCNKQEMIDGNINRELLVNPVHGAISTPGMLEGRGKIEFRPDVAVEKMIQEEPEGSLEGNSSISHLSSLISLDKINATLQDRMSLEDTSLTNQHEDDDSNIRVRLSEAISDPLVLPANANLVDEENPVIRPDLLPFTGYQQPVQSSDNNSQNINATSNQNVITDVTSDTIL